MQLDIRLAGLAENENESPRGWLVPAHSRHLACMEVASRRHNQLHSSGRLSKSERPSVNTRFAVVSA